MRKSDVETMLQSVLEELAAIEHERWSHWQRYVHSKGSYTAGGDLVIPAELAARWERQMNTAYGDLDESEKESDREQVRKYLPVVAKLLGSAAD
jgi:hypothetical protein